MIEMPLLTKQPTYQAEPIKSDNDVYAAYARLSAQQRQANIENSMRNKMAFMKLSEIDPYQTTSKNINQNIVDKINNFNVSANKMYEDYHKDDGSLPIEKQMQLTQESNNIKIYQEKAKRSQELMDQYTKEFVNNPGVYDKGFFLAGQNIYNESEEAPPISLVLKKNLPPLSEQLKNIPIIGSEQKETTGYKSDTYSSETTTSGYTQEDRERSVLNYYNTNPDFKETMVREFYDLESPETQQEYSAKAKEFDVDPAALYAMENYWDKIGKGANEFGSTVTEKVVDNTTKSKKATIDSNGLTIDDTTIKPIEKDWMGMHFGQWLGYGGITPNVRTFNYGEMNDPQIISYDSQTGVGKTSKLSEQQEKTYATQDLVVYASDNGLGKIIVSTNNPNETDRKYFIVPLKGNERLLSKMANVNFENMGGVVDYDVNGSFYEKELREKYNKAGHNYNDPIEKIQQAYPYAKILSEEPAKEMYKNITQNPLNVQSQKTVKKQDVIAKYGYIDSKLTQALEKAGYKIIE